eukprot:TRINITY_DN91475_c0_g1_i1.p1 TRINITY_DN91475_c0_g1~~TRINITY_DN91475_c0_g1_i1.p1  ORF type:complete len:991 (-),score=164.04 TRINITY_DN91475_c0_g1_i1:13-2685(-)
MDANERMQAYRENLETRTPQTVHIQVRLRNGKKRCTSIKCLSEERMGCQVDLAKVLKAMKHCIKTSGTIKQDNVREPILQLQGDCWKVIKHFLCREGLADWGFVQCHGAMGDGMAGLSSLAQMERSLDEWLDSQRALVPGPRPSMRNRVQIAPALQAAEIPTSQAPQAVIIGADSTWEDIRVKLQHLVKARGRRNYDRIQCLEELHGILAFIDVEDARKNSVFGPRERLTVLNMVIIVESEASSCAFKGMSATSWQRAFALVKKFLLHMMQDCREVALIDISVVPSVLPSIVTSHEALVGHIEMLEEHLHKRYQFLDSQGDSGDDECIGFATSMVDLLSLMLAAQECLHRCCSPYEWRIAAKVFDNIYHVDESLLSRLSEVQVGFQTSVEGVGKSVHGLCATVHEGGDPVSKTRATLQLVYHLALHGRYSQAKTLLLLSNAAEHISKQELPLQILYNCISAELGLCAFRLGKLSEARTYLEELCLRGRTSVLLGQDLYWSRNTTARHPRMNVRLIEVVDCICALLLDGPGLGTPEMGKKLVGFRLGLQDYKKLPCRVPESDREYVFAAALQLECFSWESAAISLIDVLTRCAPGIVTHDVKLMLVEKVKDAALHTFLVHSSLESREQELSHLARMFACEEQRVRSRVNQMIHQGILAAAWDESSRILHFPHADARQCIHELAIHLADSLHCAASVPTKNFRPSPPGHRDLLSPWRKQLQTAVPEQLDEGQQVVVADASSKVEPIHNATAQTTNQQTCHGPEQKLRCAGAEQHSEPSALGTQPVVCDNSKLETFGSTEQALGPRCIQRAADPPAARTAAAPGRQSLFRKRLTNLNKAVVKWLGLVKGGKLLIAAVEERILKSEVVEHLRASHGASFQEDKFVQDLILRASA